MTNFDFDLFVIGAGSGGVRAARMAASYGAKVAIAEEYRVGGTCVIRGCVPKKFLVYASEFAHEFQTIAPTYGWSFDNLKFDWKTLRNNVHNEVTRLSGIYSRNLGNSGVEIFDTRAEIIGKNEVRLGNGKTISAKYILIATGGTPYIPNDLKGSEYAISSNEIFLLDELPKSIVINGAGFIAIEFAFLLNGLGVDVTLVYRGDEVLRGFDDSIRAEVHESLMHRKIKTYMRTSIDEITKENDGVSVALSNGVKIPVDQVLLALGRKPYVKGLGLENAGVEIENDAIKVDEYSKTNIDNIYAVGDVTNRINLTPVAIREGAAFAATVFNNKPTKFDYENVASAIFSQPPVGTVGLTEHEARQKYGEIDIYRTRFRQMRIVFSEDQTRIMMKLVVRASDNVVVGCHIVGDYAPEMIQMVAIAVKAGLTKQQFDETCAVHPTIAEELVTIKDKYIAS